MRAIKINLPVRQAGMKNIIILFFSLFLTLAVFSQVAAKPTSDVGFGWGKNLQPTTYNPASPAGGLQPSEWLYYKSSNDLSAYLGKKSSSLPTARYQKGADYLEFSMTGVSSTTSVSLETNVKTPNTPTLFYRNILDGVDANYQITNIPFRVKEEIILKETFPTSLVGKRADLKFLFKAETSAKPVKQKDGSIAFFDGNDNYLFQLDKPFMVDAKGTISNDVDIEIVQNIKISKSKFQIKSKFQNSNNLISKLFDSFGFRHLSLIGNLSFDINKPEGSQQYTIILTAASAWLNDPSRAYPVIIDPTVTHNADANFTGQMNRIADNDSTSSTQLESSYPEAVKDPYTVLLLHFNEASGATAGIRDYASTTRVITANGNASTTSFVTQLGLGNSAAFDGTTDYLTLTSDSDDYTWTGDFSVDMWVRFNDISTYQVLMAHSDDTGANFFRIGWASVAGQWSVVLGTVSNQIADSLSTNTWYHIAVIRNNGVVRFFRDGKQTGSDITDTTSVNASTNGIDIGANWNEANTLNAYLDSFRILKGRALTPEEIKASASRRPYAVYTSSVLDASASVQWDTLNWTEGGVKTGDGEQPYNTSSLVAQWDFNDTSGTTLTASSSGSCTTACNGTLNNFSYTSSQDQATTTTGWTANNKKWGAGGLMMESPAAADYVSITDPASNALDPGTGDFTIEGWIKSSTVGQDTIIQNNTTVGACAANAGYILIVNGNRNLAAYASDGTTCFVNNLTANASSTEIADGRWHHFAFVADRDTKAYVYYDGRLATSTTISNTNAANPAATLYMGASGATGDSDFILDSMRFYSRALSASEILSNYNAGNIEIQTRTGATSDPNDGSWGDWKPTTGETQLLSMDSDKGNWNAPEQIDGYTKLLLHMDGTDTATTFPNSATTTHTVTAVNQAQVDTAQSKFGGGSALFDGTGDYLTVPDSEDWTWSGDFTVDMWIRFNTISGSQVIIGHADGTEPNLFRLGWARTAGNWAINLGGENSIPDSSVVANTWYHIALVKSGGTVKFFKNGVQVGSDISNSTTFNASTNGLDIAADYDETATLNGWLDELRISKGIARWTSNFTPPPRPYGSNVKASSEDVIKMEGASSTKFMIGAPQIDGNTVALWHFEETGTTTGTYLYDETANNNDATTTGTTVADGIFGKARKFNGTSDYVTALALTGGTAVQSVSFWVYPLTTTEYFVDLNGSAYVWANAGTVTATGFTSPTIYVNGAVSSVVAAGQWQQITVTTGTGINASAPNIGKTPTNNFLEGKIDEVQISNRVLSADEIAETYRMGANHHLTRQVSAVDLSSANKLAFNIAGDRPGTYLDAMLGESDYANYELASSTLALSTTTVLYIKGDEIASSTSIKDSSFSGKAITANGNARTSGNGKIGNSVYFDGTGDYLTTPSSSDFSFSSGDFAIDMWVYPTSNPNAITGVMGLGASVGDSLIYTKHSASSGNMQASMRDTGGVTYIYTTKPISLNVWQHIVLVRNGNNLNFYLNSNLIGSADVTGKTMVASANALAIGIDDAAGAWPFLGYIDEVRVIKGSTLTPDQIRQAYEYGLRTHQITIDFGATLQTSDLISNSTDYNFNITATTSGLSATTSGLYLGDKIIIKENLGGTEYTAQGTVNAINTTTGAITVPSWDTGSTFPASNGYSPNATVFKWQREYFDLTGAATTTRNAITNLTLRPTNGAEGRTVYLDDFRYNTNYLTASSSSAITSSNNRYLQYRAIFSSWDSFVSPYLSAINTLYTALANSFPAIIGISGGGFLSF